MISPTTSWKPTPLWANKAFGASAVLVFSGSRRDSQGEEDANAQSSDQEDHHEAHPDPVRAVHGTVTVHYNSSFDVVLPWRQAGAGASGVTPRPLRATTEHRKDRYCISRERPVDQPVVARGYVVRRRLGSGTAEDRVAAVFRGSKKVAAWSAKLKAPIDAHYYQPWRPTVRGTYDFCALAVDPSGNKSKLSCKPVVVR